MPVAIAMAAMTLAELSEGRFLLGGHHIFTTAWLPPES